MDNNINNEYTESDYMDDLNYAIHKSLKEMNIEINSTIINEQNKEYNKALEIDINKNIKKDTNTPLSPKSLRNIRINKFDKKKI